MYIVNNRWKSSGTWEVSQTAPWHCLINSAVIKLPQTSLKDTGFAYRYCKTGKAGTTGGHDWTLSGCVSPTPPYPKGTKTLGLEWNSSKGTICYPGQVPRRDKQTTQCLPSDRRSSASMVYSISGLHLTENIILKDTKSPQMSLSDLFVFQPRCKSCD